jgi:hypothetical protein
LQERPQGIFFCNVCGKAHRYAEDSFITLVGGFLNGVSKPRFDSLIPVKNDSTPNVFVVCKKFSCLIRFFFAVARL